MKTGNRANEDRKQGRGERGFQHVQACMRDRSDQIVRGEGGEGTDCARARRARQGRVWATRKGEMGASGWAPRRRRAANAEPMAHPPSSPPSTHPVLHPSQRRASTPTSDPTAVAHTRTEAQRALAAPRPPLSGSPGSSPQRVDLQRRALRLRSRVTDQTLTHFATVQRCVDGWSGTPLLRSLERGGAGRLLPAGRRAAAASAGRG